MKKVTATESYINNIEVKTTELRKWNTRRIVFQKMFNNFQITFFKNRQSAIQKSIDDSQMSEGNMREYFIPGIR